MRQTNRVDFGLARHFEFVEGNSSKFWSVARSGGKMPNCWGRIGEAGGSKTKTFADEQAAADGVLVLIEQTTD